MPFLTLPFLKGSSSTHLYTSSEQYFQHQRALAARNSILASKILSTNNPIYQKGLGEKTGMRDEEWGAYDAIKKGVIHKFSQNKRLLDYLRSTGTRELREATYDQFWGAGMSIYDKMVLTKPLQGRNTLGLILETVRGNDEVTATPNPNPTGRIRLPEPLPKPTPNFRSGLQIESQMDFEHQAAP